MSSVLYGSTVNACVSSLAETRSWQHYISWVSGVESGT